LPVDGKGGSPERDGINLEQDHEVREWCKSHGVTEDELRNAVREIRSFTETLEIVVDDGTDRSASAPVPMPSLTADEVLYLWTVARPLLKDLTPGEFAADIANGLTNPRFTPTVEPETVRLDVHEESITFRRDPKTVSRR